MNIRPFAFVARRSSVNERTFEMPELLRGYVWREGLKPPEIVGASLVVLSSASVMMWFRIWLEVRFNLLLLRLTDSGQPCKRY